MKLSGCLAEHLAVPAASRCLVCLDCVISLPPQHPASMGLTYTSSKKICKLLCMSCLPFWSLTFGPLNPRLGWMMPLCYHGRGNVFYNSTILPVYQEAESFTFILTLTLKYSTTHNPSLSYSASWHPRPLLSTTEFLFQSGGYVLHWLGSRPCPGRVCRLHEVLCLGPSESLEGTLCWSLTSFWQELKQCLPVCPRHWAW